MNRITHDFLVLVRRFDERAGWLKWSFERCAEWLHYRCDISKSAAREKVRVAHAIKTFACGHRLEDVTDDDIGTVDEY